MIGARGGDPGGDSAAGESYVVFCMATGFAAELDLSTPDRTNGFRLDGIARLGLNRDVRESNPYIEAKNCPTSRSAARDSGKCSVQWCHE